MNDLDALKALLASETFHHATYRCVGTLWEGLWVYKRSADGFRGYEVALSFPKGSPELDQAYELLRGIGVHVGSFGDG